MKRLFAAFAAMFLLIGNAQAGSIYLTGHDVLLHSGQNAYDVVILDYLRGDGTVGEIARASYKIGFLSNSGTTAPGAVAGEPFGGTTTAAPSSFASAAAFATFLSGIDVLVIPWAIDIGSTDSAIINSFSAEIEAFFNAGGDIFANSNITVPTFYDFLPPGATATGPSISGSSGFVATAAGLAIGIDDSLSTSGTSNVNGFPTHNSFTSFASAFTVFEIRPLAGTTEVISIGLQDTLIGPGGFVPEPSSFVMLATAFLCFAGYRRRRR